MMRATLFAALCALAVPSVFCATTGAEAKSKYEWPIAGSVERIHMHSTQGDFLANPNSKQEYWYTQRLDHFSPTDTRTFNQRFFVYEPAHVDPQAPVILYVSGHHTLDGVPEDDVRLIAKHFASPIVALEHRYYGQSQPFDNLSTKNLEFLETRQALADLANFRDFFQTVYNRMHKFPAETSHPWMTFGIGYGGALAAWMRLKYPHLVKGAIASSATINAITDFHEFDLASAHILGDKCGPVVREAVNGMVSLLDSDIDRAHIESVFSVADLENDDLMELIRDAVTEPIVYGRMHDMCVTLLKGVSEGSTPIHALAEHITKNYLPEFLPKKNGFKEYSLENLKSPQLPGKGDSWRRQFLYQQCTELGQFKTTTRENMGVIPHKLTTKFYHTRCQKVFGRKLWPDVDQTNRDYGRDLIASSHIFFLNGGQDPYRLASVSHMVRPSEPAMVIKCYNCAHGTDLRGCPSGPPGASIIHKDGPGVCQDQQAILNARKATMHYINVFIKTP